MSAKMLSLNGETRSISDWARSAGLGLSTLWARLRRGLTLEQALATPIEMRLSKRFHRPGVCPDGHEKREDGVCVECRRASDRRGKDARRQARLDALPPPGPIDGIGSPLLPRTFWRNVAVEATKRGCWIWTGRLQRGYGHATGTVAHRAAYLAMRGPIPEGLQLDHLCRVRCCVNPAHLEPVTAKENIRRIAKVPATHCKHGHVRDGIMRTTGRRYCRTCAAAASRRSKLVKAAKWMEAR